MTAPRDRRLRAEQIRRANCERIARERAALARKLGIRPRPEGNSERRDQSPVRSACFAEAELRSLFVSLGRDYAGPIGEGARS